MRAGSYAVDAALTACVVGMLLVIAGVLTAGLFLPGVVLIGVGLLGFAAAAVLTAVTDAQRRD